MAGSSNTRLPTAQESNSEVRNTNQQTDESQACFQPRATSIPLRGDFSLNWAVLKSAAVTMGVAASIIFSGCSKSQQEAASSSLAARLLADLSASLKTGGGGSQGKASKVQALSLELNPSEVEAIVSSASDAVSSAGLNSSNDLTLLMPVIAEGAMDELSEISFADASAKSDVIEAIAQGLLGALEGEDALINSSTTHDDAAPLATIVNQLSQAMIANLDDAGFSAADLPTIVSEIVGGMTGALDEINASEFSSSDLASMIEQVTAGATSGLDQISLTGYDASDLPSMMRSITAGATRGLDDIQMNGYSADLIDELSASISSGAVGALDQISMAGYDANMVDDMMKFAAQGATESLDDISLNGFDSSKIQAVIQAIASGAASAVDDISGMGSINANAVLQEMEAGMILGASDIATEFPSVAANLGSWVDAGLTSGLASVN